MKIILKKSLKGQGEVGDIIKVANGFARNYLLPKGYAIPATEKNKSLITKLKEEEELRKAKELKEAELIIKQLQKEKCVYERLADENGHLYGSVSEQDIVESLDQKGLKLEKQNIKMDHHIKEVGAHEVNIEIKGVKGKLKIKIKEKKE